QAALGLGVPLAVQEEDAGILLVALVVGGDEDVILVFRVVGPLVNLVHEARLGGVAAVGERQAGHEQRGGGRAGEAEHRQSPPGTPKGSVGLGGNEDYDTTAANGVPASYRCPRFVLHTRSFLPWT